MAYKYKKHINIINRSEGFSPNGIFYPCLRWEGLGTGLDVSAVAVAAAAVVVAAVATWLDGGGRRRRDILYVDKTNFPCGTRTTARPGPWARIFFGLGLQARV